MKKTIILISVFVTAILLLVSCGKSIEQRYIEETTKTLNFHQNIADSLMKKWNDAGLDWRMAHMDTPTTFERHSFVAMYLKKALIDVTEETPFETIEKNVSDLIEELEIQKNKYEEEIKKGNELLNSDRYRNAEIDFSDFNETLLNLEMKKLTIKTTISALQSGIDRAKNPK